MARFSAMAILKNALTGNAGWRAQWPDGEPKAEYDVVIVGAGGHGLAAAYYLAKEHGITDVAVIDKGWLGRQHRAEHHDHPLELPLRRERAALVQSLQRHIHANRLNGVDNVWLTPAEARGFCPPLDVSPTARFPVLGAAQQRRAGTARHDAVAWGFARAAAARGVDIVRNCPVMARRARARHGHRDGKGLHPGAQGRGLGGGAHFGRDGERGTAPAARELPAPGAGLRAGQAGLPLRGDVELRPCLHQPVRQGRARDWLGDRPVRELLPARGAAADRAHFRRRSARYSPCSGGCGC
jgi:hypothetical protein